MFSYSLYLMHHPTLQTLYAIRPRWAVGYPALMGYFLLATPIILLVLISREVTPNWPPDFH